MKSMSTLKLLLVFGFSLGGLVVPTAGAYAEGVSSNAEAVNNIEPESTDAMASELVLTEEIIKKFYDDATQVQFEGGEATVNFLEKHTHDDAVNTVMLRTIRPGSAPEKQKIISDKSKLLEDTKAAYEKGSVESIDTDVMTIDIAEDGQSAAIVEKTKYVYKLALSETEEVLLKTDQSCDVEILLEENIIKTGDADCTVEVKIQK